MMVRTVKLTCCIQQCMYGTDFCGEGSVESNLFQTEIPLASPPYQTNVVPFFDRRGTPRSLFRRLQSAEPMEFLLGSGIRVSRAARTHGRERSMLLTQRNTTQRNTAGRKLLR
mmetsp:Transcript_2436/g.6543  ORF Transcript_2436/g.6543 Transcript_2436/m.6543 type:complete len:113 (-) Transcript_2436:1922-2260(-)